MSACADGRGRIHAGRPHRRVRLPGANEFAAGTAQSPPARTARADSAFAASAGPSAAQVTAPIVGAAAAAAGAWRSLRGDSSAQGATRGAKPGRKRRPLRRINPPPVLFGGGWVSNANPGGGRRGIRTLAQGRPPVQVKSPVCLGGLSAVVAANSFAPRPRPRMAFVSGGDFRPCHLPFHPHHAPCPVVRPLLASVPRARAPVARAFA